MRPINLDTVGITQEIWHCATIGYQDMRFYAFEWRDPNHMLEKLSDQMGTLIKHSLYKEQEIIYKRSSNESSGN